MEINETGPLFELLEAIGIETRLKILVLLSKPGPKMCVTDICKTVEVSHSNASHHLITLRKSGFLQRSRGGKEMHYFLSEKGKRAVEFLNKFEP